MKWVLFHESGVSIFFISATRYENNCLMRTTSRKAAMEFDTAREAYEFAGDNGLNKWRVGKR